jgi:hypothetical protein
MFKNKEQIYAFLFCLFVVSIIAYYSFVTVNCLAYPWWVGLGSDGDGTYVTQTLLLINNGPLELIFHPGATAYGFLGIVLRIVGMIDPTHAFLSLSLMQNPTQVFAMLDNAMHVSRLVIILLNICCLFLFWRVLYQLSKNFFLALGLSAFFMTTYFMMDQRAFILRPEIFSFVFLLLLFSTLLNFYQRQSNGVPVGISGMLTVGVLTGFACLAKLQALPLVFCLFFWWVFVFPNVFPKKLEGRITWVACISALINILLMPWAWLKRPDFLLDYLKNLYYLREEHKLYGSAPSTVLPIYFTVLAILLGLSILVLCMPNRYGQVIAQRLVKVNFFVMGVIVSCYFVFLGLGQSFSAYVAANNHLLYSVTVGLINGGAANHRVIDLRTLQAILDVHHGNQIWGVGILWYVAMAVIVCLIRIFQGSIKKTKYGTIIFILFLGFAVDVLSTFRQYRQDQVIIVASYAIYSLSIYLCGIALLFAEEINILSKRIWKIEFHRIISVMIMLNMIFVAHHVLRMPKWDVKNNMGQTYQQEMLNTISAVPGFWHMASQGRI